MTSINTGAALQCELGSRFAECRQLVSAPFDPLSVVALTGQVLETVNHILTTPEQTLELCPNTGRPGQ